VPRAQGLKTVHVLLAHNHKFGGFLQRGGKKAEAPGEGASARSEAAEPASGAAKAKKPPPPGAPLFASGGGLYADAIERPISEISDGASSSTMGVDDDDGPVIEDITDEVADDPQRGLPRVEGSTVTIEDEEDLRDAKGYVTRPDGSKTTYFDRGTAHQVTRSATVPAPVKISTASAKAAASSTSSWNSAGTFEERDVSAWAADRLGGMMSLLEYKDDRELIIDECVAKEMEGSATIFTARGKTKSLFEFRFLVAWKATARVNAQLVCEGVLQCEASNSDGAPTLEAKAHVTTQVPSRDHYTRLVSLAESGLKPEVMHAVKRFAAELGEKHLDR
jgi:hypothetical protein